MFCNVGLMNHYNGIDGDSIERGGKYNQHSIGHEVCNFSNNAGALYGYVQPTGQIKVEKLGAGKGADFASGALIITRSTRSRGQWRQVRELRRARSSSARTRWQRHPLDQLLKQRRWRTAKEALSGGGLIRTADVEVMHRRQGGELTRTESMATVVEE
jgi:hypothetical protein